MSRCYGMEFTIDDAHSEEEREAALEIIGDCWPLGDFDNYGESTLGGGQSVEEFIETIADLVRTQTKKEIKFTVTVTYIEQAPTDEFTVDAAYYKRLKKKYSSTSGG